MGSYGVSEVGTQAGEWAGRRVNGAGLTPRSVAGSGASVGGMIMGVEARVHNELVEVRRFAESDWRGFDEEVLDWWIRGEEVEAFSKDLFEAVESWIIGSG